MDCLAFNLEQKESAIDVFESILDIPSKLPEGNAVIGDNFMKAYWTINNPKYQKILCSISGGSDSDIMLDIIYRCDKQKKVTYLWINTGVEYAATVQHIHDLEKKYGIVIRQERGIPVPLTTRREGIPFLNKTASEYIMRLQRHHFKWEDKPYEELLLEYPKCKSALEWWCNKKLSKRNNIEWNQYLKEFLIKYPPDFKISSRCCYYAKEHPAAKICHSENYDLSIVGVRKGEGGVRAVRINSCFSESVSSREYDSYRPVFWYGDEDKRQYEQHFGVEHSLCYSTYGLARTGCACCPFGLNFERELELTKEYEPSLYLAANNIFGKSYEYTRRYREFVALCKEYGF